MPDYILTVDGVNLFTTYGAYAYEREVWNTSEKEVTFYEVPGRDGDILGVNSRMPDVEISYDIIIPEDGEDNLQGLRNFLMSRNGRVHVEHSNDPDHFRQGVFLGPLRPKLSRDRTQAKGVVTFRCQPQRWLNSGQTKTVITTGTDFVNPTLFDSKPFFRINFSGSPAGGFSLMVRKGTSGNPGYERTDISIENTISTTAVSYIDIDCETMRAYCGDINLSAHIYCDHEEYGQANISRIADFPVMKPGTNRVGLITFGTSPVQDVEVTPRYWEV